MDDAGNVVPLSTCVSSSDSSPVQVADWVGWVHYSWWVCGEEIRISDFVVVFLPVDAALE